MQPLFYYTGNTIHESGYGTILNDARYNDILYLKKEIIMSEYKEPVFDLIDKEKKRQREGLELIPSENYVSGDVLRAMGSILTNKYSEGYPSFKGLT